MSGRRRVMLILLVGVLAALFLPTLATAQTPEAKVSVAGPSTPYLPNAVNEPAVAIDANHPSVLAAGGNDLVDNAPCDGSSCELTPDVGISGIYISLDEGATWVQPTYTGLTARSGTPKVGPINTLPWYYENGMSSQGDPALAFGPRPDAAGSFSWDNGSRLYYANLAFPIPGRAPFTGASAVTVSRTDHVEAAAAGDKGAWMDPVDRHAPERCPVQRQGGHLGGQRLVQPLLRERVCLRRSLPKRGWPTRADHALELPGRWEHLAAAAAHFGEQQRSVGRPSGLRGPYRQNRRGVRGLGGHGRRSRRDVPGQVVRRRQQLR